MRKHFFETHRAPIANAPFGGTIGRLRRCQAQTSGGGRMKIKMLFVMSIEEEAAMLRMRRAALLTSNRSYLPYLLELLYFRYDMRMSRAGSAGPVDAMRFERKNNEKCGGVAFNL